MYDGSSIPNLRGGWRNSSRLWLTVLVALFLLSSSTGVLVEARRDYPIQKGSWHRRDDGDAGEKDRKLLPVVDDESISKTEARFDRLTAEKVKASYERQMNETLPNDTNENSRGLFDAVRLGNRDGQTPLEFVTSRYLTNEELHVHLNNYVSRCGDISRVVKIGTSVQGRPLEALEISDTLKKGLGDGKPHVKIVGGIHGDETAGRSVSLGLAEWICENYKTDPTAAAIVSRMHLWVLPAYNPDGFDLKTRWNAHGKDLNRDFPDQFDANGINGNTDGREPETKAMMQWTNENPFIASLVFHGGDLVVNYPFDGTEDGRTHYSMSPDDETFKYLSRAYAKNHRVMSTFRQRMFPGGITNGAAWYPIYGGSQDWNYLAENTFELTVELGKDKWPNAKTLPNIFLDNLEAILAFIRTSVLDGLKGTVSTMDGNGDKVPVKDASVKIEGIDSEVLTRAGGKFTRPLSPGTYTVIIEKKGYKTLKDKITIKDQSGGLTKTYTLQKLK